MKRLFRPLGQAALLVVTWVAIFEIGFRMQQYFGNQHLVPPKFVDTIRYPAPVPKPTISDLAKDRIARIKDARPKCFP